MVSRNVFVLWLIGLMVAFGTFCGTVWAEGDGWASYGPVGGFINSIAIDPQNPSTLYAGSGSGIFKSTDAGASWRASYTDGALGGIGPLAIDTRNPNTIYSGLYYSGHALLRSTDGGLSWTTLSIRSTGPVSYDIIWGEWILAFDPRTPTTIYAGHADYDSGGAGLFKSTDGGTTWRGTSLTSSRGFVNVFSLVIDPQDSEVLYVGDGFGQVYQSTDGGLTWRGMGMVVGQIDSMAIHPQNPAILYAGTHRGVFKSTDRGSNWSTALALPGAGVGRLLVDPRNPRTVYAATGEGLFKSVDEGTSWSAMNLPAAGASRLALDPTNSSIVYVGTGNGLFKSTDGGMSWSSMNAGLATANVSALAIDAQNSGTAYASTSNRIFRSIDGARNWTELASFRDGNLTFFAGHPRNGTILYAGFRPNGIEGRNQLLKSTDRGISWARVSFGSASALGVNGLIIDPQKPNILYARMELGNPPAAVPGLLKSTDDGATWRAVGSDTLPRISISVLAIDPQNSNILYAQTGPYRNVVAAFFKSMDGGETWSSIQTPNMWARNFAIDPHNSNTVYAGGYSGVFKSTNGGMNWTLANTGFIGHPIYPGFTVNALLVDPQNPGIVYAGTSHGLYKSMDGATTWNSVEAGMPPRLFVSALAIDSQNPRKIYAASSGRGVFATFDSPDLTVDRAVYCIGDSWTLNVSSGRPTATIRLLGTSNSHAWEVFRWRVTDTSGRYEEKGSFVDAQQSLGRHTLRVEVDGVTSNEVSFIVSTCGT